MVKTDKKEILTLSQLEAAATMFNEGKVKYRDTKLPVKRNDELAIISRKAHRLIATFKR